MDSVGTTVLQLRGCSSTGKTTCVKSFIVRHNLQRDFISGIPFYRGGRYCVLGDYAKPGCCGPDTFRNSDAVFEGLLLLRDALSPEWLIFEHMILSTSYKFTNKLRKAFDGKFCAILMDAEFKQVVNKLAERNNGKTTTKYEGLLANYTRAKRTAIKLQFSGSFVEKVNPFIYDKKHMYEIIDGFIEKYERRGHVNARISDRNSELQAP